VTVRVLIVDDVPELRHLVRTTLRLRGGFEVVGEAGDGEAAVELAGVLQPDVVVLDVGLPRLHGAELLTALRSAAPVAKVAVFTGLADAADLRSRVEGYLPKDSDVSALVDLLVDLGRSPQVAVLDLPGDRESVAPARTFLLHHADRWGYTGDLYEAELVVTELVTNAVQHAGSAISLRLALSDTALRVEVADEGPGTPEPLPLDRRGRWRGLSYVSAIAQGWGVVPGEGTRKVVWARLTPGPARPPKSPDADVPAPAPAVGPV
jgi:CheY-like chemotaxis protein